ncbi:MAG: indole-3-glycerol phosphate synthase TrpC [Myxococcota bacterium]
MTILDEILAHKRSELAAAVAVISAEEMAARARGRTNAPRSLRAVLTSGERPRVITEIKRRSPSRGEIRADFDPVACAKDYVGAGAAALSVLTDEKYFGGGLDHLEKVRVIADVPILRKDFTIDGYQIDEARASGADAILLIVAAFPGDGRTERLAGLIRRAGDVGVEALVEVHDEDELETALAAGADLVGINNRNLATFEVDLATTERLAADVPSGVVLVAESGIFTHDDIRRLEACGAHGFLVGESLMREPDVGHALRKLRRNA